MENKDFCNVKKDYINPIEGLTGSNDNLLKINEPWNITQRLKDYSINPVWAEGLIFNDAIPAEYGLPNLWTIISGSSDDVGVMLYERIANFVQNNRDIDVCSLHALHSIARAFDQEEIFSYDLVYPVDLERLMNLFSINPSILLTSGFVLNNQTLIDLYSSWATDMPAVSPVYGVGPSGVLTGQVTTAANLPLLTGDNVILDPEYLEDIMEASLRGLLIEKTKYAYLPQNINLAITGTYVNVPEKVLTVHRYNVAQEYIGFLEDIMPTGNMLFCPDTSGIMICEATKILRDIATRSYYHRETLKNVYQKYNMLGSTNAVEKLVQELILRAYTNPQNTWRYAHPCIDTESAMTSGHKFQYQYWPLLKDILATTNVKVIEYWDKTDYMDISAATPLVCGIIGYNDVEMTSAWIDTSGNYVTGTYIAEVPVYGTGPFGHEIEGGRDRFWEGDVRRYWMETSEHTQEEVDYFFQNLSATLPITTDSTLRLSSAEYASAFQDYLWDTFAVSGFNRMSIYPDLTGVPAPRYSQTPPSAIPADGWLVEPTYLNDIQKKYIGHITGDMPAANYRSQHYPTIAPQPFIWNLIRKLYDKYPEIIPTILYRLDSDEQHWPFQIRPHDGQLIDSWQYFNQELVGYQTFYEASLNLDYNQVTNPDVDRDGPWHAEALDTYLVTESGSLTEEMSGFYHQIAPNFRTQLPCRIRKQLRVFQEAVKQTSGFSIHDHDQTYDSQYGLPYSGGMISGACAHNYAVDIYDNHYTLFKQDDQLDQFGTPFMRFKNHPISFPICYGYEENVTSLSAATAILADRGAITSGDFTTVYEAGTGYIDGNYETFEYYDIYRNRDNTAVGTWYTDASGNLANPWQFSNTLRIFDYELHQLYVPYSIYNLDYLLNGHTYLFAIEKDDYIVIGQDNTGQDKIIIFQAGYQDLDDLRIRKYYCTTEDRDAKPKAFAVQTNEKTIPREYPYRPDQVFEIKNYVGYYTHEDYIIFVYAYHIREGWADFIWIYWNTKTKQFEEPQCSELALAEYKLWHMNHVDDKLPEEEKVRLWETILTKIYTQGSTPFTQEFVKPSGELNRRLKPTTMTMSPSGDVYFIDDSAYNDPITGGPILYRSKLNDWKFTSTFSQPTTADRVGITTLSGLPTIESLVFVGNRLFGMSSCALDIYEFDINTGEASVNCTLKTNPDVGFYYKFTDWCWNQNEDHMLLLHPEAGNNEVWKFSNTTPGNFAAYKLSNLDAGPYGIDIPYFSGSILEGLATTVNDAVFSSLDWTSGDLSAGISGDASLMILGTDSITGVVDEFWDLGYDAPAMFFNKTV